jgi:type I restriction enzyme M protein
LFINTVNDVTRERAQSFLEEAHIQKIFKTYQKFAETDDFARVVTLDEIRANNANLSIALYVRPKSNGSTNAGTGKALAEVIDEWQASSKLLRSSMDRLLATLNQTRKS